VTSSSTGAVVLTSLTAGDLTTLKFAGSGNVSITTLTANILSSVDASAMTTAISVLGGTSLVGVTATGGSGGFTFTGGTGADSITGGSGTDALIGGTGNDSINGAAGVDAITGGTGGDSLTGGSGVDTFNMAIADGVVPSATSLSAAVASGDTITFSSTAGVDSITDFTAGSGGDVLNFSSGSITALTSGIGLDPTATNGFITTTLAYYLSGVYTPSTGVFTILADGVGNSTLVIQGSALALSANTTMALLIGVNSADLLVTTNVV